MGVVDITGDGVTGGGVYNCLITAAVIFFNKSGLMVVEEVLMLRKIVKLCFGSV